MPNRWAVATILGTIAATAALAAGSPAAAPPGHAQIGAWGLDLSGSDPSVKPGDDFERYANGHWDDTTQIPPDRAWWGSFAVLRERSVQQVREILEALPPAAPAGSNPRKLGDFYRAYLDTDASLVEINPLLVTGGGDVLALDAKMTFDDNALFRRPEIAAMRDLAEENPMEVEAAKYNLNYIKLDGNIACMVNGAGLAMATMDIIKLYGGEPANFLDVGGGASQEAVKNAFRLLVSDPGVRAVLINIFGGIARTDRIARGVVGAIEELGNVSLPVVVRLEGTNVEQGREVLRQAPFHFIVAEHMADAAEKAVAAAREAGR